MGAAADPTMLVVAGPSGSGKSSLFPVRESGYPAFNVDDRCSELNGGSYRAIPAAVRTQAQRECEAFVAAHIADRRSFAVETTLRSDAAIRQAASARAAGFFTELVFVSTRDVELNVQRVMLRALDGGHSAPPDHLRLIYRASMANLARAAATFEQVYLYDASAHGAAPVLVGEIHRGQLRGGPAMLPDWLRAAVIGVG